MNNPALRIAGVTVASILRFATIHLLIPTREKRDYPHGQDYEKNAMNEIGSFLV